MQISVKRRVNQVGKDAMYKYVHSALIKLWKDCVREFIKAASEHIHIDTGMSVASLQPLAANVGLSSFLAESLAGRGFVKGVYSETGRYNPKGFRSKAEGRRRGERAYELTFGTPQNTDLRFVFKIKVFQWKINEISPAANGDPWRALEYGRSAFVRHWNANFKTEVKPGVILSLLRGGNAR